MLRVPRGGGRKTLLPAAGERRTCNFPGNWAFSLSLVIYSTINRFLPTAATPFSFRIDGQQHSSAIVLQTNCEMPPRQVLGWVMHGQHNTTGPAAHWKALRGPGRAKAARSLLSAALANAISCPTEVLPAEMIILGLSLFSRTREHIHACCIWSLHSLRYPHHTLMKLENTIKWG